MDEAGQGPIDDLDPWEAQRSPAERIAEIRDLLKDLDNTSHWDMTPLFYTHGYFELEMAVRDLLSIIDAGIPGQPDDPPTSQLSR